ncbi:MAG: hypothetical protein ACOC0V_04325, partial [Oceanicaulis sp.]
MSEPVFRSQRYSARYGARDPWLAGAGRAGVYLIWRAMFSAWRPVIFLMLMAGATFFMLRAADVLGPPQVAGGPDAPVLAAEVLGDPQAWWRARLQEALAPSPGRAPDLPLAESLSQSLTVLAGEERLARAILLENGRSDRALEAELRAVPGWRADRRFHQVLENRLHTADPASQGGDLVFAPRQTVDRLQRARVLYGPALEEVEAWFAAPQGRTLSLRAAPGLAFAPPRAALYGDVRDVIVHGCALAEASGRRISQCRVVFLPKPPGNVLQGALALTAAQTEGRARIGARLLKAASAAGMLERGFMAELVMGADETLAREAVLASAMGLVSEAGDRYTRPVYSHEMAQRAGEDFAAAVGLDQERRDQVLRSIAEVRREAGAVAAIRTAGLIESASDAEHLVRLAEVLLGRRRHV